MYTRKTENNKVKYNPITNREEELIETKDDILTSIHLICEYFGVDENLVTTRTPTGKHTRKREISEVRHVLSFYAHQSIFMPISSFGRLFIDNQDHTSILHGRDSILERIEIYPKLAEQLKGMYEYIEERRKEIQA